MLGEIVLRVRRTVESTQPVAATCKWLNTRTPCCPVCNIHTACVRNACRESFLQTHVQWRTIEAAKLVAIEAASHVRGVGPHAAAEQVVLAVEALPAADVKAAHIALPHLDLLYVRPNLLNDAHELHSA